MYITKHGRQIQVNISFFEQRDVSSSVITDDHKIDINRPHHAKWSLKALVIVRLIDWFIFLWTYKFWN